MSKLIETWRVTMAVQTLVGWCKRRRVEISPKIIAEFAMAWREQRSFEWTPCEETFRRINAVPMDEINPTRIAIVFNYRDYDIELTRDLNEQILRVTQGKWLN